MDWQFGTEEGFGWIEGENTLSELLDLRQEILQQDYRGLYLEHGLKRLRCQRNTARGFAREDAEGRIVLEPLIKNAKSLSR